MSCDSILAAADTPVMTLYSGTVYILYTEYCNMILQWRLPPSAVYERFVNCDDSFSPIFGQQLDQQSAAESVDCRII